MPPDPEQPPDRLESLVAFLASLEPLDDEFPAIEDLPPEPVDL
jgi:antitoxin VapB